MAKYQIFTEEFKQNVSESCDNIKEKLSDALLTEEGKLDTEKIGGAARDTAKKVEEGVKESYRKFNEEYKKEDGSLDKEKLGEAANRSYRKAGRFLATGVTRLAEILSDKFGTNSENGEIIDSELVTEEPVEEPVPVVAEEPVVEEVVEAPAEEPAQEA